ncbi:hypothetical protein Q2T40_01235 [Winogradskyella maritima]|nr:hypothetical protein [Winogradskyella maritima]
MKINTLGYNYDSSPIYFYTEKTQFKCSTSINDVGIDPLLFYVHYGTPVVHYLFGVA